MQNKISTLPTIVPISTLMLISPPALPNPRPVLGDRQRRRNVGVSQGKMEHKDRLAVKCNKERTRRNKMKALIYVLKTMLRNSMNLSRDEYDNMETADVLELVLEHVKASSCPITAQPADPAAADVQRCDAFRSGVDLCAVETMRALQRFSDGSTACTAVIEYVQSLQPDPVAAPAGEHRHLERIDECSATEATDSTPNVVHNDAAGVLLDLRTNGRSSGPPLGDSQTAVAAVAAVGVSDRPVLMSGSPPARPEVLQKIRRQIFARRRVRFGGQLEAGNRSHDCRDDGYDSDEAQFVWRPWY